MSYRKVVFPILAFLGLGFGAISVFLLIIPFIAMFDGLLEPRFSNEPFYILVLGLDDAYEAGSDRTDAINVIGFSPSDGLIGVLPVPRDLVVEIPTAQGAQRTRINALYKSHGLDFLKEELEKLLKISIERHIIITYDLFRFLGDRYGPIPVDVRSPMRYQDLQQDLDIDIPMGRNMMMGSQLLNYIRFRDDTMGDLGRIQRQKEVVQLLLEAMKQKTNLFQLPSLYSTIRKQILWDIDLNDLIYLYIHFGAQFHMNFLTFPFTIMANGDLGVDAQRINALHVQLRELRVTPQVSRPQVLVVNGVMESAFTFSVVVDNAFRPHSVLAYTIIPDRIRSENTDQWLGGEDSLIFLTQDPAKRNEMRQTLDTIYPSRDFQEIYPLAARGLESYYGLVNLLHEKGYFFPYPLDAIIYIANALN